MAYKVIILYRLYMPSYFLGTFTEYPYLNNFKIQIKIRKGMSQHSNLKHYPCYRQL